MRRISVAVLSLLLVSAEVWDEGTPEFVPSCGSTAKCQRTDELWDEDGCRTRVVPLPNSVLSKFKIRPSIVPIDEKQDSNMVTAMIYSVIERWADKDLYQILPEFTIERMAMRLAVEIKAALPPGFVLVALELDQGPTRVTVMPSANP